MSTTTTELPNNLTLLVEDPATSAVAETISEAIAATVINATVGGVNATEQNVAEEVRKGEERRRSYWKELNRE